VSCLHLGQVALTYTFALVLDSSKEKMDVQPTKELQPIEEVILKTN